MSETTTEELPDDAPWWLRNRELLEPAVAATALLAAWLLQRNAAPPAAWGTLFVISYFVAGWSAFAEGLRELRRGHLDVDFLMAVAALGAAAIGEYAEGAMLLVLFSLGHGLEHYAMGQARKAIRSLGRLTPKTAWVRQGNEFTEVAVASIALGDLVRVRPAERVAMDGTVAAGARVLIKARLLARVFRLKREPGTLCSLARSMAMACWK